MMEFFNGIYPLRDVRAGVMMSEFQEIPLRERTDNGPG